MEHIDTIQDLIKLPTKEDVLKLHLYTKFFQKGIKSTDRELNVLVELFLFGGYSESTEQLFIEKCIASNPKTTPRTILNTITKYVKNGVILKHKKRNRSLNKEYIPELKSNTIGLHYKILNYGSTTTK